MMAGKVSFRVNEEQQGVIDRYVKAMHLPDTSTLFQMLLSALRERRPEDFTAFLHRSRALRSDWLVPMMGKAPCGELAECLDEAAMVDIGYDVARLLGWQAGDFIIEVSGNSMVSESVRDTIPHGSWLQMRPGAAQPGEVALVRVRTADDAVRWTVKRYCEDGNGPQLKNGSGGCVPMPEDMAEVQAVAVQRGIIAPVRGGL